MVEFSKVMQISRNNLFLTFMRWLSFKKAWTACRRLDIFSVFFFLLYIEWLNSCWWQRWCCLLNLLSNPNNKASSLWSKSECIWKIWISPADIFPTSQKIVVNYLVIPKPLNLFLEQSNLCVRFETRTNLSYEMRRDSLWIWILESAMPCVC